MIGGRIQTFDVSRPDRPRMMSDAPGPRGSESLMRWGVYADPSRVMLLPLPGLPPAERLAATLHAEWSGSAFDGQVLCTYAEFGSLAGYRLRQLTADAATFAPIGRYHRTLLQDWAGYYQRGTLRLADGLLYIGNSWGAEQAVNVGITVLDTRGRRPMREVGHFAAPGADSVCPLPDGRAIVAGGNHVWLVAAPKRDGG